MDLSIIIPVYNEGNKIDKDIQLAAQFLHLSNISGEIIISDDGSTDDTVNLLEKIRNKLHIPLKIIANKDHRGKGHAVKSGILKAQGKLALFIDSGACVPYDDILPGIDMINKGQCEIAHGSRFLKNSLIARKKQWYRRLMSYAFRMFIQIWAKIPNNLTDTQCGLKIYKREVAHELYRQCITEGFMFDVEIILRAAKAGYKIEEFPISWTADLDSRLSVTTTFFQMLSELARIKKKIKY